VTARADILARLRAGGHGDVDLPGVDGEWRRYDDPRRQFADAVQAAGGTCVFCRREELGRRVDDLRDEVGAGHVVSAVPEVDGRSVRELGGERECADVELLLVPGDVAVAENGAIWVSDGCLPQRAALFLAQHLGLVVASASLVDTMHEAYAALAIGDRPYGVFLAGPSKTADIEQCLVIGAHGPRSARVFVVD